MAARPMVVQRLAGYVVADDYHNLFAIHRNTHSRKQSTQPNPGLRCKRWFNLPV
jgi:hypothetical protein